VFAHGQPVLCERALPKAPGERQTHAVAEPGIEAVRAARQELDAVIEEIRGVEGFEQFLAPPTFDDICRTAGPSPLVYFAAADQGGLALVVRDGEVTHVPLEELSADELRSRVEAHLDAYTAYRRDRDVGQDTWSKSLSEVTRWLWRSAVGPVLDALADAREAVFIAGGLLGLLPMHAAWAKDPSTPTGRRYALDQLTISYAPNARALQVARDLAETVSGRRLLAVVEPAPVDAPPLSFARWEARGFAAGAGLNAIELPGVRATPLRFRQHAPESEVLHLACHGWANLTDPLSSGLLMATGRRVTLGQLMEMRLRVRLAVLSACETALPGTELPDEVIGLPTGLLQAGVAGVVASQWAVLDRATAMLMTEFARRWAGGKLPPGAALRQAQQWLRDTTNRQKRAHWLAALHKEPTLPADVVEEFVAALSFVEPDRRDHEDLAAWAAFAHLGA
jgi:CHAT domain-containing protein